MPIFLAVPLRPEIAPLAGAVEKHIAPSDRHKLQADGGWLIKFEGTTIELSNLLEVTGQPAGQPSPVGSTLLVLVGGSYYGRGPSEMWEWLKTRIET